MRQTGHFTVGGAALRPHDHVAYVGRGAADFSRLAMHVVASASPDQRIVVCADTDWEAAPVLQDEVGTGRVLLLPVAGIYDALFNGGPGSAAAQLRDFDGVVEESLQAGYASIRIVADNTALLTGPADMVERWLVWEQGADRWLADRPVTGFCYFGADGVPAEALASVARRHPLTGGLGGEPTWFVHHELVEGAVVPALVGAVEAFDAQEFARVVETEFALDDTDGPPVLDLSHATYVHHRAVAAIGAAAARVRGRPARLTCAPGVVARLCSVLSLPTVELVRS